MLALLAPFAFSACQSDDDDDSDQPTTGTARISLNATLDGADLDFSGRYTDNADRSYWFTALRFYLSNIRLETAAGTFVELKEVYFFDFDEQRIGGAITSFDAIIPSGSYRSISFDCGVRQDLNQEDPATYETGHPLSIANGMYWTWSTQYIFAKFEGWVQESDKTSATPFVVHPGTADFYRPDIRLTRNFELGSGGTQIVSISLNLNALLEGEQTIDLVTDGQSHTTDAPDIAAKWMDNFSKAFE